MKKLMFAAVSSVLMLAVATPLHSQAKIKIAIWDFENFSQGSWWYHKDLGPAARNGQKIKARVFERAFIHVIDCSMPSNRA